MTIGLLRTIRYFDPIKTANLFGRITRFIGPMTREQKIARANLTAAFPEKSPEEIETILAADRGPYPWRSDYPPARSPLPRRIVRGSKAGSRRFGANRRSGNHAGHYLGGRRLDPRISRPVAMAASPLAMTGPLCSPQGPVVSTENRTRVDALMECLNSRNDRAALFRSRRPGLAIQVEVAA